MEFPSGLSRSFVDDLSLVASRLLPWRKSNATGLIDVRLEPKFRHVEIVECQGLARRNIDKKGNE